MNLLRRTLLFAILTPFTSAAQEKSADIVAGKVLSARDGRPLAKALVSLERTNTSRAFATIYTDEEGNFRFDNVPAGKYRLQGRASGYTPSLYLQHDGLSTAIVTGAGLGTASLTLTLTPTASISGHILDDTGEPVIRANVTLYRRQTEGENKIVHFRSSFANEDNVFDFADLPPGRYFLSVTATPWYAVHPPLSQPGFIYRASVDPALDAAYPLTFYPAATSDTDASPIDLKPGDDFIGDLHLTPVHALSLSLSPPAAAQSSPVRSFNYTLSRTVFGQTEQVNAPMEGFDGTLRMTGLAPGQYQLRNNLQGKGSRDLGPVNLTSESVTLAPQPSVADGTASVHVSVHASEGTTIAKNTFVALRQRGDAGAISLNQTLNGKDEVDFDEVPAGEYRFAIYGPTRPPNLAGVQVNGQPVPTKVLRVNGTDAVKVDLTLGGTSTSIEGSVRTPEGKPFVPCMVILVPAGRDTNPDLFRRDQTDLDGSFTLPDVLPGNYLILALDDAWKIRWNDASTVTPYLLHALPVTVQPDGPQSVHLKEQVIPQPR